MVNAIDAGEIRIEAMERILDATLDRPNASAEELLEPFRRRQEDIEMFESRLLDLSKRSKPMRGKPADTVMRWAMGELMPSLLGRLDPSFVRERVTEVLREDVTEAES